MAGERSVVVTGAGSGIGRAIADMLVREGVRVFGLDLSPGDESRLLTPIQCDVASASSVAAAASRVAAERPVLAGLVNCAGVPAAGPLLACTEEELLANIDVNALGAFRVTKALFPQLLEHQGRIVTVTSLSALIAFPYVGPYVMSKHAAEGMAGCLRRELSPLGVSVSTIVPGKVRTPLFDRVRELVESKRDSIPELFRERALRFATYDERRTQSDAVDPERVAAAARHALFARRPRARYLVVRHPLRTRLILALPQRVVDRMMAKV